MKLWLATSNPGKVKEFLGGGLEVELLPGLAGIAPPEENGETFEANAILKAKYYAAHATGPVLAEDSGLEVDALDGAPGVYSARFAERAGEGLGEGHSDDANNAFLLRRLAGVPERKARYVCVIALADGENVLGTFRGAVEGEIVDERRGEGGFGYDPYFFCPALGKTFAEATLAEKATVSHRGQAISRVREWIDATKNTQ
ncbi:MAG: RdgB/HAM1 family non-canonical purine NTP pyrophosphatase [Bryobacter sp.]|nr:RdgB/HAM1 family non-canonical purine NTP pyrophosphatase [Bryobacter sp.]